MKAQIKLWQGDTVKVENNTLRVCESYSDLEESFIVTDTAEIGEEVQITPNFYTVQDYIVAGY